MTASQAKALLLKEVEDQVRHDSARRVRQIEEETKRDAERRVRNILSVAMQRLAAGHAAETTVSVVQLPADDMKGRIIGREGRNIRALENLTGVDFIIDDTPNAVVLSGFDGVRREIARMTLEKLLEDGRIHPARIEETYYQAKSELESHIAESGEQACFEANVQGARRRAHQDPRPPEVPHVSYGQNVLAHSVECAQPRGDDGRRARRVAPRPRGARRCCTTSARRSRTRSRARTRSSAASSRAGTARARRSRTRWRPTTTRSSRRRSRPCIVQSADALSGARPGARGESLEQYVKRLRDLEQIATRHDGVDKVYAMQAGREIRVMVTPSAIDDDGAILLSHEIAREIEQELEYPGQIKVTVIRESRHGLRALSTERPRAPPASRRSRAASAKPHARASRARSSSASRARSRSNAARAP